jgi:hypothetical protein
MVLSILAKLFARSGNMPKRAKQERAKRKCLETEEYIRSERERLEVAARQAKIRRVLEEIYSAGK